MTNKKKILVITAIPVLAAAILAFSLGPSLMNMGNAATVDKCEPKVLGALQKQGFVVKQPSASSLPMGYSLQSVEDNYAIVHLYYADHAICQPNTPTAEWAGGGRLLWKHQMYLDRIVHCRQPRMRKGWQCRQPAM